MKLLMTEKELKELSSIHDNGYPIIAYENGVLMYNNSTVKKAFFGYKRVSVHQIPIQMVKD